VAGVSILAYWKYSTMRQQDGYDELAHA